MTIPESSSDLILHRGLFTTLARSKPIATAVLQQTSLVGLQVEGSSGSAQAVRERPLRGRRCQQWVKFTLLRRRSTVALRPR